MNTFEKKLVDHAYYGFGQRLTPFPVAEILEPYQLSPIGKGHFSRVYDIKGAGWVVKEGRWDLDFEILKKLTLPVHARLTEGFLSIFRMKFLPSEEQIVDQYNKYLEMSKYLGYFDSDEKYYHLHRGKLFALQKEYREHLERHIELVSKEFSLSLSDEVKEQILSPRENRHYNFLPKEYLLYGPSIHPSGKGYNTSYIFQEKIDGKSLYESNRDNINARDNALLLLFALSSLALSATKSLIPDLRPKYLVSDIREWLWKTENLYLSSRGPVLVDTRWLWSMNDNLVKRGFMIPELTVKSLKRFVNSA